MPKLEESSLIVSWPLVLPGAVGENVTLTVHDRRRAHHRRRLKPALQLNDAAAGGDRHRLRAILGAEFVHDVLDMDLDGLLRDE